VPYTHHCVQAEHIMQKFAISICLVTLFVLLCNGQSKYVEAYWHYYIFFNSETLDNLAIESIGNKILFGKAESVTLPNGQKAIRISSLNPEKIEDNYDFYLSLVREKPGGQKKLLILKLPLPDSNQVHLRVDDNGIYYIELYINF
jgi:hypothetical protein